MGNTATSGNSETGNRIPCDIAILGGGIAGLWLLNLVLKQGYRAVLLEPRELGGGQTLASQGMIHGGVKYTLGGNLTPASETIASMPDRWRACLAGEGDLDLRSVELLSEDYFLFSDGRLSSKLTAFFGSRAIEGRVEPVREPALPELFRTPAFGGLVYRLQDVVINTPSLVRELAEAAGPAIHTGPYTLDTLDDDEASPRLTLGSGEQLMPRQLILAAGEGNGPLIEQLGLPVRMQLRPLNQVVVRSPGLPRLFAHAVSLKSADKPRLTITTHPGPDGNAWYLGGQLAETGVDRDDAAQIAQARRELATCFPWMNFDDCAFSLLRINRAEADQADGQRPDTPFARRFGRHVVCWPTKLTLAPLLGDKVMPLLDPPGQGPTVALSGTPRIGTYPWDTR